MSSTNNKNALSHGLYARDFLFPWESEADFSKHYQEIHDHFQPVGPPQEEFVRDIAHLIWKKRRLIISSQLAYAQHPDAPAMAEAGRDGWEGLGRYLQQTSGDTARLSVGLRAAARASACVMIALATQINNELSTLAASPSNKNEKLKVFLCDLAKTPEPSASSKSSIEQNAAKLEDMLHKLSEISMPSPQSTAESGLSFESLNGLLIQVRATNESVIAMLKFAEEHDLEAGPFERAYCPAIMERDLKIAAMLDKQLDKAIQRLVNQKEYDRMYRKNGGIDLVRSIVRPHD
jgi:hypothetical protein